MEGNQMKSGAMDAIRGMIEKVKEKGSSEKPERAERAKPGEKTQPTEILIIILGGKPMRKEAPPKMEKPDKAKAEDDDEDEDE